MLYFDDSVLTNVLSQQIEKFDLQQKLSSKNVQRDMGGITLKACIS